MAECAFAKSIKQTPKYCDLKNRDWQGLGCGGAALVSSHRELPRVKGCRRFACGSGGSAGRDREAAASGFGCFVGSDKTACALCVLLLTASWLGSSVCDVTTWDSDRRRTGVVCTDVFWNYCVTRPQNGLAG